MPLSFESNILLFGIGIAHREPPHFRAVETLQMVDYIVLRFIQIASFFNYFESCFPGSLKKHKHFRKTIIANFTKDAFKSYSIY